MIRYYIHLFVTDTEKSTKLKHHIYNEQEMPCLSIPDLKSFVKINTYLHTIL